MNFLEDFIDLFNVIADQIREGLVILDKQGRVRTWNNACEKIYDLKKEEILGNKLEDIFPNAIDVEVLKTGKTFKDVAHRTRGNHIMISAAPLIWKGEMIGVISTDRDLEEVIRLSKKLEEALKTINVLKDLIEDKQGGNEDFFIGNNRLVNDQLKRALMTADTDIPVLITGETGTGKEVLARFIHRESKLESNFVAVNCSAIPDTLFESEFFGYVKGAFTGADNKGRAGYFEQANGGTLFLDEISEMPLTQQTKLLRVLQEGKVRRLGSEKDIPVNARIISACNADLQKSVEEKQFRIDLYYRIKGIDVRIPPLRERKDDLEDIIRYFFEKMKGQYKRDVSGISDDAMGILKHYYWAGNMRELENAMRQMVVMTLSEHIEVDDIPREIVYSISVDDRQLDLEGGLKQMVQDYEEQIILNSLEINDNNIARTAEHLKIPRTTLQSKLSKIQTDLRA